ncbi:hypothetical protein AAFF_G00388770 [Aldrovandia affinis]|uniref:Uncharacterized protein n=1 Tax=Aldrovandia affinis TaxID=143900 RepID=A0AAD7R693_9TELE|nr:hypothetical protein AAFF_G00388770 [Aldrovandia affinis]
MKRWGPSVPLVSTALLAAPPPGPAPKAPSVSRADSLDPHSVNDALRGSTALNRV